MAQSQGIALVTGAGSGFGQAMSLALAQRGWHVWATDKDEVRASDTAQRISEAGGRADARVLDVTDELGWRELAVELAESDTPVGLLVNNAGMAATGRLGDQPLSEWRLIMDVNYWGCVLGCEAMLSRMRATRNSHIVNVASFLGFVNGPRTGAYSASKAALISFSESLWCDLRQEGIGVTVLCPGFFASALGTHGLFTTPEEVARFEKKVRNSPLDVETLVRQTLAAIDGRRLRVITPRNPARLAWWLRRIAPDWSLRRLADYENRKFAKLAGRGD